MLVHMRFGRCGFCSVWWRWVGPKLIPPYCMLVMFCINRESPQKSVPFSHQTLTRWSSWVRSGRCWSVSYKVTLTMSKTQGRCGSVWGRCGRYLLVTPYLNILQLLFSLYFQKSMKFWIMRWYMLLLDGKITPDIEKLKKKPSAVNSNVPISK